MIHAQILPKGSKSLCVCVCVCDPEVQGRVVDDVGGGGGGS